MLFIEADGRPHRVAAVVGQSLMRIALDAGVPGIGGICGGDMCCATCVVRPTPEWVGRLLPPAEEERTVVEGMPSFQAGDRLGCQIRMQAELDGLVVHVP